MKKMNRVPWMVVLAVSLILAAPSAMAKDMTAAELVSEARKNICEVTVSEAKDVFDKGGCVFVDCRTEDEYKMGHVPGALHVPRGMLEFKIDKQVPDKDADIVIYCKKGGRGCLAACTLCRMGYKSVKNMDGGWMAWEKAGYPVE